ncbi:MAG: GspE/PulE family protein [bacterium]
MALTDEQYSEALVESGGISREVFDSVLKTRDVSREKIEQIIISKGILTIDQFGQLMGTWYGIRYVDLKRESISANVLELIPEQFARKQRVLPVKKEKDKIFVAISEPENINLRAQIEKYLRTNVDFIFATAKDIDGSMFLYHQDPGSAFKAILERGEGQSESIVTELVNAFFDYAYQNRASDIHIEPEDDFTRVRFRIDGILQDMGEIPKKIHESIVTRLKVLSKLATDEHRAAQDGKIEYETPWGDKVEIRLSIVPTTDGEKSVMRLLSAKTREFSLSDLGLNDSDLEKTKRAIKRPWGMILSTGPTGSGKTTTLYSIVRLLNKREVNISTIEDPVEYDIDGVNQIQVNTKTNLTFAKGLRSIVRQDPDIIMVGEIRDAETADIAVNAAMTGHLVLSTLHTNDAATSFPRIKDMGVEDFLVASTVVVIVAQRLVRKICLSCITSYHPEMQEIQAIEQMPEVKKYLQEISEKKDISKIRLFKGQGCAVCGNKGYDGRTGLFEVLVVDDEIREAIMQDKNADEIRDIAMKAGMTTMMHDGIEKVLLGITTLEEVFRVTQE